ncbi:MAG TPA: alpha/beta hydrolase [Alphaproteobacteria bacterium]|nr:alpha/beta hydrolase [Alphaproteobacteria bacterium]
MSVTNTSYTDEKLTIRGETIPIQIGGEGPPLLLLHGAGGAGIWMPFHAALARHFTVYAPVHPGFAGTDLPDWVQGVDDLAFHYFDLLDALKLSQVTLAGISLGGWIATEMAVTRPERFSRLALLAPVGVKPDRPMPDLFIMEPQEAGAYLFSDPGIAAMMRPDGPPNPDMIVTMWSEQAAVARLMWKRAYGPKLPRRLHHISMPTLLLWGDGDRLVPPEHGEKLKNMLPDATLKIIAGAGHASPLEKPQELADAIIDFAKAG